MGKNIYLGLDVSKGYSDIVVLDHLKREITANFQLDDTFNGHSKLYNILRILSDNSESDCIYSAVESTGGYENNWYNSLKMFAPNIPIKVARLNPSGVHFNSKAALTRVTTDKVSARNIAEYLISHPEKVDYETENIYSDLRKQMTFIEMLKSQQTQLSNQLESLCYSSFPEIISYLKSGMPLWALNLLRQYPTAERLSKAHHSTVCKIRFITDKRAKELIARAKDSVASDRGSITEQLIKSTIDEILHLRKMIDKQVQLMIDECHSPEFELLKSFPGIAELSAIKLLIEIGSVERFAKVKNLVSYFGLHPAFKQSGDGTSKPSMSKQGRVSPRATLFMVALSGIRDNPILKKTYNKHISRGMAKSAAIGVCMHKALRIIYGMLKNKTSFSEEIDMKNQHRQKNQKISDESRVIKERRYQEYDDKAPISKRQSKKRTARNQHQNDKIINCGVTIPDLGLN